MSRTTNIVAAGLLAAMTVVGCSGSPHAKGTTDGTGSTAPGGGTATGSANGSGGNGAGTGTNGGVVVTTRTTLPFPTTTAPSTPNWLKAHTADLRALHTAVNDVNAAFQANDDAAKKTALVECANAAAPLAQSARGSLPTSQADAMVTISDGCAAMAHDLKSGDTAAVATGKTAFDKAVVVITQLFP